MSSSAAITEQPVEGQQDAISTTRLVTETGIDLIKSEATTTNPPTTAVMPPVASTTSTDPIAPPAQQPPASSNQIEEGLINEMKNFDNLLRMLSVYRDNPDFRGQPGDRNIEEIAKVLSGFIGDDLDNFLSEDEDDNEGDGSSNDRPDGNEAKKEHGSTNNHDDAKDEP